MDVVWQILSMIVSTITPFLIGFLIAYILNFPYKFFYSTVFKKMGDKHKALLKLKKPLSIVCTYTLVIAILVFLISIIVPQIFDNITNLVTGMPEYFKTFTDNLNLVVSWLNSTFNAGIDIDNTINEILANITSYFSMENIVKILGLAGDTTSVVFSFVADTVGGVYNFAMGAIISVYFLSAKDTLCYQIKKLAVAFIPIKYLPKIYEIVDVTDTKCGRFLIGDILDAALVGLLHFIVLAIFQIPYAPLIAVMVGITNIIPFFGPFIGSFLSCFILLLVNPWDLIWFLIINIIIQQLDGNLFKPKIIGGQVGLSSFWVLFSVLVGGALFGFMGLILGTPIYAVIYTLVGKRVRNSINDKGKIAQEALDFEVLNYTKIAEEQKRIREEKENQQREKLRKLMHLDKFEKSENVDENDDGVSSPSDNDDDSDTNTDS
jgi:predicted PurR-regulated permease PerM